MLYVMPAAGAGAVTVMVPVRSVQLAGLVATAVGAVGVVGTAATGTSTTVLQPDPLSTVIVCGPGRTLVYPPAGYGANAPPSKLNVSPAVAEVIVIVPVATVQVGSTVCVTGVAGAPGAAATVALASAEIQPAAFCAVTV